MISEFILQKRARLLQALRDFFHSRHFLEVETPLRIPAPIPEAHIEPLQSEDWYLHASPELFMKRLLVHGIQNIFQICRVFRKAERGTRHLPEFSMLEWYRVGFDYEGLMCECEDLFQFLGEELNLHGEICVNGRKISLIPPWERLSVEEAFQKFGSLSLQDAMEQDSYEETLVSEIEPYLGIITPTFLYDYPLPFGSLARLKPNNPSLTERFELYAGGVELANGFSELTDPVEQRRRFTLERKMIKTMGRTAPPMPEIFLRDLENLPPSAGIAMGIDRLAMIFFNKKTIDEVVAFVPEELA